MAQATAAPGSAHSAVAKENKKAIQARNLRTGLLFTAPALIVLAIFVFYPAIKTFITSLTSDRINRAINDAGMSSTPQTLRNVSLDQLAPMVSEGLITVSDNHRVVPTRRGRLLNDSVIEQFFDSSVYESVVWCAAVAITCSLVVVTPSEGAIFVLPAGEGTA